MMQTISKKVLTFLEELKQNNDRDWFNDRKSVFKKLEKEVKSFYEEVGLLINEHDVLEKIKPYRIYRDIWFSKDKTPYKEHFGVNFQRKKPELRGGYYLRIKPGGNSFVGGGFWNPSTADLKRVRKEWEIDTDEIRELLNQPDFKNTWGEMLGETLKTAPRGFDKEHPDIDIINHKQWMFKRSLSDKEVLAPTFARDINEYYKQIRPFFDYMTNVLTTDLNGVSLLE